MSVQGTTSRKLRHPWAKKSNVSRPDFSKTKSWRELVFVISDLFIISNSGADLGGGCRGWAPPRWDYLRFSNTTGILQKKKKTMWFIGVEVEQETSAPPPKKNPGSAPAIHCFLYTLLPSPRDKLESLGQILIKWNVRYWLNTSLFYFHTWFKQQRNASYDISK